MGAIFYGTKQKEKGKMRRNLREDVDVWENYGNIWTRRYAGGSGKWEELSESEKLRYQSKLREQAIAAGMPEDLGAMSPPPKILSIAPPAASAFYSAADQCGISWLADRCGSGAELLGVFRQRSGPDEAGRRG